MVITEDIHDQGGMAAYGKAAGPSLAGHDVKVLAADRSGEVIEGTWHGQQTVLLEFESAEAAMSWYHSDGYQSALPLRQAAATCNAVLLSGLDPPPRATA